MMRKAVMIVCLVATAAAGSRAGTVVEEMMREVRARDYYASVNPRLITESPTLLPNRVVCQVCVEQGPYDMPRFGQKPIYRCAARLFEVDAVGAGFIVRDLQRP
jgi:hypothetical protein